MPSTVVRGALGILTGRSGPAERACGDIRIRAGRIVEIGALAAQSDETTIDASGCVVYPGFVNTHHHLFQSVLKGIPAAINAPLETWAPAVLTRYWTQLDAEALEVAVTIGIAELLLSGTTTVADHHFLFSERFEYDPAEVIFAVARRLGVRLVLCRGGSTQPQSVSGFNQTPLPVESLSAMLQHISELAARYHDSAPDAMQRLVIAPSLPLGAVRPGELRDMAAAARAMGLRLHTHLSETLESVHKCEREYGRRPVAWLAEHDWSGEDVWFAHLVHVDALELQLLAQTGTGMAHCPQSNARLGAGIAPAPQFAALGGRVGLAVDGAASNESSDMIGEVHFAWLVHRATGGAGATRAEEVLRWASAGGAQVLGLPAVGTIEVGKAADLSIFDLAQPRYAGMHDPLVGPIVCGGGARPRHVLVNGRAVVRDGEIPGLDPAALCARAAHVVRSLK